MRFLASSKVDSKRRVRIPNGVRDALGIKEGDSVRWFILSSKIAGLMVESDEEGEETKGEGTLKEAFFSGTGG